MHVGWKMLALPGDSSSSAAILGGWAAVEWVKRRRGIVSRTGDLFAVPLAIAIAVGRIGCFSARPRRSHDGQRHHCRSASISATAFRATRPRSTKPSFAIVLAIQLSVFARRTRARGRVFQAFILAYCAFRLGADFLKPYDRVLGLCPIQWAALGGMIAAAMQRFPAITPDARQRQHDLTRVRPYMYYDVAVSICAVCYRRVEAKIVFEDEKVFMLKRCPGTAPRAC